MLVEPGQLSLMSNGLAFGTPLRRSDFSKHPAPSHCVVASLSG
jgi:hypothetical protein